MADDVDIDSARVTHLERQILKLGSGAERALLNVIRDVADDVVSSVRGRVPRRTGTAASTYRAMPTSTGVDVSFGGSRAPYVPWLEFGGKAGRSGASRPYVPRGRYLFPAMRKAIDDWESEILRGLDGLSDLEVS